nr:DUF1800 family protein [Parvularcula mediterranea]
MQQASFGGTPEEVSQLRNNGIEPWLVAQLNAPYAPYTPRIQEIDRSRFIQTRDYVELWWERIVNGDAQLRERMAYALSQIVVVSLRDPGVAKQRLAFATYTDLIQREALGNYCDLIREVTMTPAMGIFLTHLGNKKADAETGFVPDENYAREILQLFTIGLETLDAAGRSTGAETYTPEDVSGLAAVFTGLSWADTDFDRPRIDEFNRYALMEGYRAEHEAMPKSFLGTTIDFGEDAETSVAATLDFLLSHPNVAPFISKQLIQKLVTSNPSPQYVRRVAETFEAGRYTLANGQSIGTGRRCDLAATAAAILTDEEARRPAGNDYGKIRSPILRLAQLIRTYRVDQEVTRFGEIPNAFFISDAEDSDKLGVNAFLSPSVFNFYRPGYVGPGTESADLDLVTPEYQLATTPSLVGYINAVRRYASQPNRGVTDFDVAVIDYQRLTDVADDATALLNRVDGDLTGGLLSAENREKILSVLEMIEVKGNDADNDRKKRVETALFMVAISPEYVVQR